MRDIVTLYAANAGESIDAGSLLLFSWQRAPGATTWRYLEGPVPYASESGAEGLVAFEGQSAATGFAARPVKLDFEFSNYAYVWEAYLRKGLAWSWDPATRVLDPAGDGGGWEGPAMSIVRFTATEAQAETRNGWDESLTGVVERGRWEVVQTTPRFEIWGGHGADTLQGAANHDNLIGGLGDDLLVGMAGDDTLFGSEGADTLRGGAGNDRALGTTGNDLIELDDGRDLASGGSGQDTIRGGAGHDTLAGFFGDDLILGEDGNDVLQPGEGRDTLDGGAGFDTLDLRELDWMGRDIAPPVHMVVRLDLGYAARDLDHWRGEAALSNIEAVIGSLGSDHLTGDDRPNVLDGGGGAENSLTGGGGADRFVLGRGQSLALRIDGTPVAPTSLDWITDFNAAEGDRVDLRHFGVSAAQVSLTESWGNLDIHLADTAGGSRHVATLHDLTAAAMGPSWMIV